MFRSAVALVALLALSNSPVHCIRPVEDLKTALLQAFKSVDDSSSSASKPWFCHDLECPSYKVTNHTDGYETRVYEKAKWAATKVEGLLYSPSVTVGFKRLFDYISGENDNSTKIAMTAPVFTVVEPGQGPFCKSNFTISFFVPSEFQEKTPKPTHEDVFIATVPQHTAYVSQFGGYLVDDFTLNAKAKALRNKLVENGEDFDDGGSFFTASYDPPFRVQHRHNEVMFVKKSGDASKIPAVA